MVDGANGRSKASHERSLFDVMAEWRSGRDYEIRIANISSGDRQSAGTFLRWRRWYLLQA